MGPELSGQQRDRPAVALGEPVLGLVLLVNGASASSARAIRQVHTLCEQHLRANYTLRIIDVQREPELLPDRVLAVPTLLREGAAGGRMVVGDFSDARRVLDALAIPTEWSSMSLLKARPRDE